MISFDIYSIFAMDMEMFQMSYFKDFLFMLLYLRIE